MTITPPIRANKAIARRFLLAIATKDAIQMRSLLAPDAHLSLMVAGVYSPQLRAFPDGTQWGRESMIEMEMDFQRRLDGPFELRILSLIGEGDLVAAEVIGSGCRATTGRRYIQHYSYHFRFSNSLIVDIRRYQDTFHHWDVWSDLVPVALPPYLATCKIEDFTNERECDSTQDIAPKGNRIVSNKNSVRYFLTSIRNRDPELTRSVWASEGRWSFAIGGDYRPELRTFDGAPRWDREEMISMQQSAHSNLKEPLTIDIYSLIEEADEISAEAVGFLVHENGRAYRQHYGFHFTARNGRLIEGHVYQDTLHQYDISLATPHEPPVTAPGS